MSAKKNVSKASWGDIGDDIFKANPPDDKIGTFPALRHRATYMFGELEFARSVVRDVQTSIDEERKDITNEVQLNIIAKRVLKIPE